jgi:hypothetical protein
MFKPFWSNFSGYILKGKNISPDENRGSGSGPAIRVAPRCRVHGSWFGVWGLASRSGVFGVVATKEPSPTPVSHGLVWSIWRDRKSIPMEFGAKSTSCGARMMSQLERGRGRNTPTTKHPHLGSYSRPMPRILGGPREVGVFRCARCPVGFGDNQRTAAWQKCGAVPRRARIQGS